MYQRCHAPEIYRFNLCDPFSAPFPVRLFPSERSGNDEMERRQFFERIYNSRGKTIYNRLVMLKEINEYTFKPRCGEIY